MPLPELPLNQELGIKRAAHLLRRTTFGATKSQIDTFAEMTLGNAITALYPGGLPDPILPIDPETGQEWFIGGTSGASSPDFKLTQYFCGWFMAQMIGQDAASNIVIPYSAREKLVFFLHTHFTCIASKVQSSRALYFQNQLFRQFALDRNALPEVNLKTLTVKLSVDNAMLKLLDGNLNVKGRPNENYARELLELYSIGRGLEGTIPADLPADDYFVYTEEDVRTAALVLSGWEDDEDFANIDPDTTLPRGKVKGSPTDASAHNNDVKVFSDRFANQMVTPDPLLLSPDGDATEASALDEIRQLVDIIYSKRETAKNICWKIYRFFVYSPHEKYTPGNLVADIDENIIEEMADTFIASGYKIQPVIENLLRSEHFYEQDAGLQDNKYGGIIKSPLDLILGTFRMFDVKFPDMASDPMKFYESTTNLLYLMKSLGMNFYEPFDVAGYEAYHQFPIYNRMWITPGALATRYNFIRILFRSANPETFLADALTHVQQYYSAEASNARTLILEIAKYIFPVTDGLNFTDPSGDVSPLTPPRLNFFLERFLQDFDEAYWTERWNENAGDLREQLEFLFNAMLQTPEYQLA